MLVKGQEVTLVALLLLLGMTIYLIRSARAVPPIRKIAGLEAVQEAIGRATETGRPVFYTPGLGNISSGSSGVDTMAAVEVLSHVAALTAQYKLPLTVGVLDANTYAVSDQTVREAYIRAGQPDLYNPEIVQFMSPQQFGYAAACSAFFEREHPAAIFLMGFFQAETVMLAESAALTGAIVIGGMVRYTQLPSFVASCDYTLIAEELYVAGAYLSKQPAKMACIRSQDIAKLGAVVLIAAGAIMATFGSKTLIDLLK